MENRQSKIDEIYSKKFGHRNDLSARSYKYTGAQRDIHQATSHFPIEPPMPHLLHYPF